MGIQSKTIPNTVFDSKFVVFKQFFGWTWVQFGYETTNIRHDYRKRYRYKRPLLTDRGQKFRPDNNQN